ncbi:esterase family protein [SAR86 cluster bacterium]|nr:esterase family protein [SAR86 cluster bacterium]
MIRNFVPIFILVLVSCSVEQETNKKVITQLHDVKSEIRNEVVPVSVILPPGFEESTQNLPLLINLHGGGGTRDNLLRQVATYQEMFDEGILPPMVVVSFSSGRISYYHGTWEAFVTDELPLWASRMYGVSIKPEHTLMTGISMGGYGSLKIGLKNPERFKAIAPMEPAIMPILNFPKEPHKRNSWWTPLQIYEEVWGKPFDPQNFMKDNPANIAIKNAERIKKSGLDIYLEVGDEDFIQLHDGAEFLHRVFWDNDIRHEYHLVRWADHVGLSMKERTKEAHAFLAASLLGGKSEPIDLPLTPKQLEYAQSFFGGDEFITNDSNTMQEDLRLAPTLHAELWKPLKKLTKNDPNMERAYGKLPDTKLNEEK